MEAKELKPKELVAEVGSVRLELNAAGMGKVWVDGEQMKFVRRVVIDAEAGKVPRVTLEILPVGGRGGVADSPFVTTRTADPAAVSRAVNLDHLAADPIIVRGEP